MSEDDKRDPLSQAPVVRTDPAAEKRPDLQALQSRLAALRSGLSRASEQKHTQQEPPTVVQTSPPAADPTPLPAPIIDESSHGIALPHLAPAGLSRRPGASGPLPPSPGPRKTLLGMQPAIMPPPSASGRPSDEPARLPGIASTSADDAPDTPPPIRRLESLNLPGTPRTPPEDEGSTQRVERFDASDVLDSTPPPLPPSPASDAEAFFDDVPTRPAAIADLASMREGTRPSGHVLVPKVTSAPPIFDDSRPFERKPGVARSLVALGVAAAFAVGLTLGAVLFRGGSGESPPPAAVPPPAEVAAAVPCTAPVVVAAAPVVATPDAAVPGPDAATPPPDAGPPAVAASATTCSLEVKSAPAGAEVFVDGKSVGPSPAKLDAVPCGAVSLRVAKERYLDWKDKVVLRAEKPQTVEAQLRRGLAKVTITSAPSGAKVYVGGRAVGQTPLTRDFPAFTRAKVQVVAPGFRPVVKYVYPKDKNTKLAVTLVKDGKKR